MGVVQNIGSLTSPLPKTFVLPLQRLKSLARQAPPAIWYRIENLPKPNRIITAAIKQIVIALVCFYIFFFHAHMVLYIQYPTDL